MKIATEKLILDLVEITRQHLNFATGLQTKTTTELNWKKSNDAWSVLECLEHLNLYGDFYLPEMGRAIKNAKSTTSPVFKSGVLGNYFAESMLPKENFKKMKTFKDKDPISSFLDRSVIERFSNQQIQLLDLLNKARKVNLSKEKTAISISKLLKLRLGDTFRFVINHNTRHIQQMETVLQQQSINN